jgi:2-deoxy-D-gluconate 3-dehydrogenase
VKLFDLDGRVAVVTGGNGGIGLGMARGLAAAGCRLVLSGRDSAKGAAAVATLQEQGAEATFVATDVTRRADCAALMHAAMTRFGRLDILINNAGISIRQRPEDFDDAQWHAVLDTNLTSAFLCAQEAYPLMKQGGGGKIVNIASVMSLVAAPYSVPYAASKGGLLQLTKGLAAAWAADNIQVNAILPGWIDTEMTVNARDQVSGL